MEKMKVSPEEKKSLVLPDNKLYIGVSESAAKGATHRLLEPPIILTDAYAGSFALAETTGKWGILEIDADGLLENNLLPFHGYLERLNRPKKSKVSVEKRREEVLQKIYKSRTSWLTSLEKCGVCLYNLPLYPGLINRIGIFNPTGNNFILENFAKVNPWEVRAEEHRANLPKYRTLSRWLVCHATEAMEWMPEASTFREVSAVNQKLANKESLDLFYQRNEKEKVWWRA